MRARGVWGAAWTALVLLGCAPSAPKVAATSSADLADGDYISQQGRLLLGFRPPDVRTFGFPPLVTNVKVAAAGQLVADHLSGRDFVGMNIKSNAVAASIAMRIKDVLPPAQPGDRWRYVLEEQDPMTGTWLQACADPPQIVPPSTPLPIGAIALQGSWTDDGGYVDNPSAISFSCAAGVAAKCVGWGYPWDAAPPNLTETGHPSSATGADVLQACTRMARADFCAVGVPNTLDGTPIHVHDAFGGPLHPEHDVHGFFFEAAWLPSLHSPKGQDQARPPVCLSKKRWSTLPLGGGCDVALPDPRVRQGKFCEDYSLADLEALGAVVYSDSSYIDAGLYSWGDPTTTAPLTTSHLLPGAAGSAPTWIAPPPAGLPFSPSGQPMQFEGALFSPDVPAAIAASGVRKLVSYWCLGPDYVTTTTDLSATCMPIAVEGYVYPSNKPGHGALRRWWHPVYGHSLTTTKSPTTMIADGWQLAEVVGALPRAAMDLNVRWSGGYSYALDVQTRSGEWIAPCIDNAIIGGATSVVYAGSCPSAANRRVSNIDIATFRVRYTVAGVTKSAVRAYDGSASDVYVDLPGGATTALAVAWNDKGPSATYALDVRASGGWTGGCFAESSLANDTSVVFTGHCPDSGATLPIANIDLIRVCAAIAHDWAHASCTTVAYDGHQPSVGVVLP
jgi:hypothetical protein